MNAAPTDVPAIPQPTDSPATATAAAPPPTVPPASGVTATHVERAGCAICGKGGHTAFAHIRLGTVRVADVD